MTHVMHVYDVSGPTTASKMSTNLSTRLQMWQYYIFQLHW